MKLTPNIFQREALQKLDKTKENKGVIVMPTGTGKTFLASIWFKGKLEKNPKAKLLFICHNKDILSQANEREFQVHLKEFDISYGYYNAIEKNLEQVTFATTQTLARNLEKFDEGYFDYMVVDECHHYQARTFKEVVKYFKPIFMLGLTATPHRMDMKNIFTLLGDAIYTAKIFEAIKKGLLSKINYYAVDNDIDFSNIEWNGYKYSEKDLNKKLCVKKYDESILKEYQKHIKNLREKTICFCASVEHCYRMEDLFRSKGINAVALTGKYEYKGIRRTIYHKKREDIIRDFRGEKYDIIFVRDLFNEGVDIPIADCVMMLRPTFSSTIYTQQIGRGLRKHTGKKDLLILDFTGNANKSELNMVSMSEIVGVNIIEEIKKKLKESSKSKQIMIVTEGGEIRLSKTKLKLFESYFSKKLRNLQEAIEEFKKIYGNKKPSRSKLLYKEKGWMYYSFKRHGLLDKYCQSSKLRNLQETIEEFKQIYGNKKPFRRQLYEENERIYSCFKRYGLLDKYCQPSKQRNLQEAIEEYKKIYGDKKPFRRQLYEENTWMYSCFRSKKLLNKYCQPSKLRNLQETIEEFKQIYGDKKPFRNQLRKENGGIYSRFLKNNLLNKYCQPSKLRNLQETIEEFKKIYGNKKPSRNKLIEENKWIYNHFLKNKLLDKYCQPSKNVKK